MRVVLTTLSALALLAFGVLAYLSNAQVERAGGSALDGGREGARCWVQADEREVDVPEDVYRTTLRVELAWLLSFVAAGAGAIYLSFAYLLPRLMFPRGVEAAAAVADEVRRSGPEILGARIGGRIGVVGFGASMLGLSIRPGGIVVEPRFLPPFAVRAAEVRAVTKSKRFFVLHAKVEHASREVASPLLLAPVRGEEIVRALERFAQPLAARRS